jgi:hypothetical protein
LARVESATGALRPPDSGSAVPVQFLERKNEEPGPELKKKTQRDRLSVHRPDFVEENGDAYYWPPQSADFPMQSFISIIIIGNGPHSSLPCPHKNRGSSLASRQLHCFFGTCTCAFRQWFWLSAFTSCLSHGRQFPSCCGYVLSLFRTDVCPS